ncbi:MAG: glycerophosphodiester phosphodiesterase family protein [Holosporales bacterium]|jgi:glycerophosphoryl diester phosphodiesterase|nr:glycerophosphodiester phosphodiesterase family protein [Holosporales bacterium]
MTFVDNPVKRARKNGVLLAAHRGTFGGNIIQNTIPAFENALKHGADILELDVAKTIDGDFFVFHIGQESCLLGTNQKLDTMTTNQVLSYNLYNSIQEITSQKINTLSDVLDHFKQKCLINIDRGWFYWEDLIRYLENKGMKDQIILKSPPEIEFLKQLEDSQTGIMYMPIIRRQRHLECVISHKINLAAVEVIFSSDDHELAQAQFIEEMHNRGLLLWVNAIVLNDKTILSGGHDDNRAITQNMHDAWGWLIDRGYDIILTDRPLLFKSYIAKRQSANNNSLTQHEV